MAGWIKGTHFEGRFDTQTAERLAALTPAYVPKGTVLFRPGDAASGFVLVLSGRVNVYLNSQSGRELLMYSIEPGQTCLQTTLGLLGAEPYTGEAVAVSDIVAVTVPLGGFRDLMATSEAFRGFVFKAFAQRIGDVTHLLEQVAFASVERRLARWFLEHADADSQVLASHAEIATAIGSAREVVSRRVEKLAHNGLIIAERKRIVIRNAAALAALAGDDD
ncbi:MAG: Crp/Fnr family transcriptional regulator [Pseudomonadota bacterium]